MNSKLKEKVNTENKIVANDEAYLNTNNRFYLLLIILALE
jgi:hypothetical protein